MLSLKRFAASFAFLAAVPMAVQAYAPSYRLDTAQVGNATFEVVGRPGSGAREFWCAAGLYVQSLGARSNTRIYLVSGRQPSVSQPGRTAVRFTTDPSAAGITPISPQLVLTVNVPGDNLSMASAREYCTISISRP